MIYYLIMIRININEAKIHLSRYIDQAIDGETVMICRRNVAVAELRAVPRPLDEPRPVGLARGRITVPDTFFEPLPEDLLDDFEGRSS